MRLIARLGILYLFLFPFWSFAQSPTGTVSGRVLDPDGRAIAEADVLVVNDLTGLQYSGKSNEEGIYLIANLPPGQYRLQVSKVGFKAVLKPDIVLNVQDALSINFKLPIGAASITVTVEGGAPVVNTQSTAVSTVVDRNFVESLPLNGRSFNMLLQLTPGVVITPAPAGYAPGQFSVAGQRTDANNFFVDGVSANFGVVPGAVVGASGSGSAQGFNALGGTSSLVSVEALQEFRVETSSFAPEFGRNPGGQVILTTRSGTNSFHGGIYEYFRNDVLDANDWFANAVGHTRAPERHNDFGGFLGGRILKDKTFFFFSYEGARLRLPQTQTTLVPSNYARSVAPAALVPYLNAFPLPEDRVVTPGIYTVPFTGTFSNRATLNATSVRIDHTLNRRFSLFGRYNDAPSQTVDRASSLSELDTTIVDTRTLTLGVNMAFKGGLTNTLRGNYSTQTARLFGSLDTFGGAVPPSLDLFLGSLPTAGNLAKFDSLDLQPYFSGPSAINKTKQVNVVDDVAFNRTTHQFKLGADYRAIFLDVDPRQHNVGIVAISVKDFITNGALGLSTGTFAPVKLLSQTLSVYGQDTWRVTGRLNITYGVRWELSPAPSSRGNTAVASWENVNNPSQTILAPAGNPLWTTTYGNFAPRGGLAYSLTSKRDLVLRVGGGIFYDIGVGSSPQLANSFPNAASTFVLGVLVPPVDVAPYLPRLSEQPPYSGIGVVAGFDPNLTLPRSYQWNVALEKGFGGHQAMSVTYVGQAGRGLLRQEDLNPPNLNFASDFVLTRNNARSNYDALQLQYRKPLGKNLHALFSYTWSHSLDNASNDVIAGISNTVISAQNDYSSSDFDVRHSFSGALTYSVRSVKASRLVSLLTSDWSVDGVIVARTGVPFNAVVASSSPGGRAFARPDIVSGQPIWISNNLAPGGKSLNPDAFSVPTTIRQGTEGRNNIPGFGLVQVDLSVAREFPITEHLHLQFRADGFNVFNHPNFTNPPANVDVGGTTNLQSQIMLNQGLGGLSPLFQEGGPRSLQLSLRLHF